MAIFPGWKAPDFMTETGIGPIRFHTWGHGCWRIVLTHPGDYSIHSLRAGLRWARTRAQPVRLLGLAPMTPALLAGVIPLPSTRAAAEVPDFPIVHDETGHIAALWRGVTVDVGPGGGDMEEHAAFIVDPGNTVRSTLIHPVATERDFNDIIRVAHGLGAGCPPLKQTPRAA
ncbi:peroxidase [Komagataeibacter oboediens]|uniref:Peroxidase n=1 Tax=Komagataeibacter oboediens TaxID=65958 RepID=A0A318QSI5_9PROT|nr:peroxidase [Komagataeibacter oboediens]PYD81995.1 peroxidase [Komagataeibacter oboediens]